MGFEHDQSAWFECGRIGKPQATLTKSPEIQIIYQKYHTLPKLSITLHNKWKPRIAAWNERFAKAPVQEVLEFFTGEFGPAICLSSSMGAEDQVLTDMLVKINPDFRIFTLDTGRLFPETLNLIQETQETLSGQSGGIFSRLQTSTGNG